MNDEQKTVKFDYIKSNQFRVIHGDGVIGSITPKGNLFVGVFSERAAIPQHVVFNAHTVETSAEGSKPFRLGEEVPELRVGRDGIVRETEVGIVLDLEVAQAVYDWLGKKIETMRAIKSRTTTHKGAE